jgi:hypothetical protein
MRIAQRVAHDYVRVYSSLAAEPILRATGGARRGITMREPPLPATEQKKQGMMV